MLFTLRGSPRVSYSRPASDQSLAKTTVVAEGLTVPQLDRRLNLLVSPEKLDRLGRQVDRPGPLPLRRREDRLSPPGQQLLSHQNPTLRQVDISPHQSGQLGLPAPRVEATRVERRGPRSGNSGRSHERSGLRGRSSSSRQPLVTLRGLRPFETSVATFRATSWLLNAAFNALLRTTKSFSSVAGFKRRLRRPKTTRCRSIADPEAEGRERASDGA